MLCTLSMTDVRGTKTHQERLDDEAERLIRPSPKQKPPRHDKRRERIEPLPDPDLDKTSMTERLVVRATEWVKVRNKDKDHVTRVTPETLKDHPELYEKVPKNEPDNQDGIRPPRKPAKPAKPHYHKDHLPHPAWPEPRPLPDAPPRAPKPVKPVKPVPVPEPAKEEHAPKEKPPGWVPTERNLTARLLARWKQADDELVNVRRKEDGRVVRIKPETLKEAPSDYEQVEDEEEGTPAPSAAPTAPSRPKPVPKEEGSKPAPGDTAAPDPVKLFETGEKVRALAKDKPEVASAIKALSNPKSPEFSTLQTIGDKIPAAAYLKGNKVEGLETVKDLIQALSAPKPEGWKPPKKPKPKAEPEAPAPAPPAAQAPAQAPPGAPVAQPAPVAPGQPAPAQPGAAPAQPGAAPAPQPAAPAPAAQPPATEEKPGKKKDKAPKGEKGDKAKPKEEDKAPADKPSTPATPQPQRPPITPEDQARSDAMLTQALGPKRAKMLQGSGMHPHDLERLAATYEMAKSRPIQAGKLDEYVQQAKNFYQLDPSKVKAPAMGKNAQGEEVPYAQLSPQEQAETWAEHRTQVVAMSLAVRHQVFSSYRKQGAPKQLAKAMMAARLQGGDMAKLSRQVFAKTVNDGRDESIAPGKLKKLLESSDDPAVQQVAASYVQARSYQKARRMFLDPSSPRGISEHMSAAEMADRLTEASGFLREADKAIPWSVPKQNLAMLFRNRVYASMAKLNPKKSKKLLGVMDRLDAEEYKTATKEVGKAHKEWAKNVARRAKEREQHAKDAARESNAWMESPDGYRTPPPPTVEERIAKAKLNDPDPPPPMPPEKPARFDMQGLSDEEQQEQVKGLFDDILSRQPTQEVNPEDDSVDLVNEDGSSEVKDKDVTLEPEEEPKVKTASLLVGRALALSTCGAASTMASTRTALYWGVDPYPQDQSGAPYHYTPWGQAHARDLDESDYKALEASAREWLKSPVLSKDIEGMVPDARFRAALDLAIRTEREGRYSVGIHPAEYNRLLAKIGGVESPDKATLLTIQAAQSTYPTREAAMKPSQTIRQYAARVATTHPTVAFDLLDLADKVAEDEQAQKDQKQAQDQQGQEQQKQAQSQDDQGQQKQAEQQGQEQQDKQAQDQAQQEQDKQASYTALRSACVKVAHDNLGARKALLPVLELIKRLG